MMGRFSEASSSRADRPGPEAPLSSAFPPEFGKNLLSNLGAKPLGGATAPGEAWRTGRATPSQQSRVGGAGKDGRFVSPTHLEPRLGLRRGSGERTMVNNAPELDQSRLATVDSAG